jgi:hypothetical protein
MVLAGYVLARSIGGRRGVLVGLVPGTVMGGTVLVTGNHYVLDGAAGSLLCLGPAVVLERARWQRTSSDRVHLPGRQGGQMAGLRTMGQMLLASQKAQISIATVGLLLLYLVLRQPL